MAHSSAADSIQWRRSATTPTPKGNYRRGGCPGACSQNMPMRVRQLRQGGVETGGAGTLRD